MIFIYLLNLKVYCFGQCFVNNDEVKSIEKYWLKEISQSGVIITFTLYKWYDYNGNYVKNKDIFMFLNK